MLSVLISQNTHSAYTAQYLPMKLWTQTVSEVSTIAEKKVKIQNQ